MTDLIPMLSSLMLLSRVIVSPTIAAAAMVFIHATVALAAPVSSQNGPPETDQSHKGLDHNVLSAIIVVLFIFLLFNTLLTCLWFKRWRRGRGGREPEYDSTYVSNGTLQTYSENMQHTMKSGLSGAKDSQGAPSFNTLPEPAHLGSTAYVMPVPLSTAL